MILWNKDVEYLPKISVEGMESLTKEIMDPLTRKRVCRFNLLLNIILPVLAFYLFSGSLMMIALSFVVFDFLCILISNYLFNIEPYNKFIKLDLKGKQKLLEQINQKLEFCAEKKEKAKRKVCNSCSYSYSGNCHRCKDVDMWFEMESFYLDLKSYYEDDIKSELEQIKRVEIENDKRKSNDYTDKLDFLQSAYERIVFFDEKYDIVSMKNVTKSLKNLIFILQEKPIGFQLMRVTIFTYIDELLSILDKWQILDKKSKEIYISDIEKISEELGENIRSLSDRISKMEVQDIDVSISVLLSELKSQNEKEGV